MRFALLAWPLLLAGCGGSEAQPPTPAQSDEELAEAIATSAALVLTADGIVRTPEGDEPSRSFTYGTPRATVESIVARFAGEPTGRGRNEECGAGPMEFTQFGTLTLNFQDDLFVGWFADEGAAVPTMDGILPGVTRAQLEAERPVAPIPETTLEGEFEYRLPDGSVIGGFLDGEGPGARVGALYAGTNCFFR